MVNSNIKRNKTTLNTCYTQYFNHLFRHAVATVNLTHWHLR